MIQAIQQLASDLAKQINEIKIEDGLTIICTRRELHHMIEHAVGPDIMNTGALCDFYDEMQYEHNLFLTVSQFDDVVLDERPEEL